MFERRKARKQMEEKLNAIQVNLENNYKDLTLDARKEAGKLLDALCESRVLKDKDIEEFRQRLEHYDRALEHYGHANISSFLKERY